MAARWGDDEEGEGPAEVAAQAAPKIFVSPPDKDGVKVVTELRTENGQTVKVVRKIRVTKKTTKLPKAVAERRNWKKFGDCAGLPPGLEPGVTYTSMETINLVLKPRKRGEEEEQSVFSALKNSERGTASIVTCQLCKEKGHFTLACPRRAEIEVSDKKGNVKRPAEASKEPAKDGKYVPMHKREGADKRGGGGEGGGGGRDRNDDNTIRLSNLSQETEENDIRELCRAFGYVSRVFLCRDRVTNESRGFAFITFENRDGADTAVKKLNGHGYDSLILHAEFAKPREEGEGGQRGERDRDREREDRPPRDRFEDRYYR